MDYLDTILGALIAWGAYRTGVHRERKRRPGEKQPICGCGHHRSYHEEKGGCRKSVGFDGLTCRCQKYIGPIPYDEFIAEQ